MTTLSGFRLKNVSDGTEFNFGLKTSECLDVNVYIMHYKSIFYAFVLPCNATYNALYGLVNRVRLTFFF